MDNQENKRENKKDVLFQKAEGKLYNYNKIQVEIKCLEYEKEMLKEEYEGCKAITYSSEKTGITNDITDSVYRELIRKEKEILDKTKKIARKKLQIKKIDEAITLLDETEKKILDIKYFTCERRKSNWKYVGKQVGYSERQCISIRDEMINKIKNII